MYKVTVDGVFAGYSDTAVFVRLHENGCYIPCEETEAEGVCVKLPYEFQDDEGNTVRTVEDIVFSLTEGGLSGIEQVAELEHASGPLMLNEAEAVVEEQAPAAPAEPPKPTVEELLAEIRDLLRENKAASAADLAGSAGKPEEKK